MRKILGRALGDRRVVGGVLLIIQFVIVMTGVNWLSGRWEWMPRLLTILSLLIVIWLVRKYDNPTYKISWIVVILLMPLFGGLFYLFWGNTPLNRARTQHKYEPNPPDFKDYKRQPATEELARVSPRHAPCARYVEALDGMPVWTNTETKYFRVGEEMFASMCEELWLAKRFIFLEYFIVEEGVMWDTILDILQIKVRDGVDVRVMYDDVGSIATLPKHYDRYLASLGIRAVRFNRFIPTLNTYLNYRNHRKMMIIDGNVSYMGGINIADEYINKKVRFGHWKDTGVMLRGEG
ncbi:MAG: PLDc N-terminal domain-containing protein, partial [Agathobaculum sp.]|uniref:PLDc N-terminal domain-containing protein n=1 Tax=Agathobaculum sp. TaxID=2048138 RepID=UPI003D929FD9